MKQQPAEHAWCVLWTDTNTAATAEDFLLLTVHVSNAKLNPHHVSNYEGIKTRHKQQTD